MDSLFKDKTGFEVSYHFHINESLSSEAMHTIRAVAERPELWQLSINGIQLDQTTGEYWIDKDFPVYAIGQHLKSGKNTLTLKAPRMNILAEVMPVYILGDFLVKSAKIGFEITGGEIRTLGSWSENGLPFYSQQESYTQQFHANKVDGASYKIKLNHWNGTLAEVLLNNRPAGVITWRPYTLDVTDLMNDGLNEISVKVTSSLKNTFGFFYHNNDNWIFGPHSWNTAPEKIPSASDYFLMDYRLFEPFQLVQIN